MKIRRYMVITGLLTAYAIFMTLFFGLDLLKEGHAVRFWITLGCETAVIILAFIFLRKRDNLRRKRQKK